MKPDRPFVGLTLSMLALVVVLGAAAGVSIWIWAYRGKGDERPTAGAYAALIAGPSGRVLSLSQVATSTWEARLRFRNSSQTCWIIDLNHFQLHVGRSQPTFDGAGRVSC